MLAACYAGSVTRRVALGPHAGKRVVKLGAEPNAPWVELERERHANHEGFDLHADVALHADDRQGLEQLLRYGARPAVASDRLRITPDGRVALTLKRRGVRLDAGRGPHLWNVAVAQRPDQRERHAKRPRRRRPQGELNRRSVRQSRDELGEALLRIEDGDMGRACASRVRIALPRRPDLPFRAESSFSRAAGWTTALPRPTCKRSFFLDTFTTEQTMRLAQFITASSKRIISEWEQFARSDGVPAMGLEQRRDHVEGMLKAIALDLDAPQTKGEQKEKAKGNDDADVGSKTSANAHGSERAAIGYTPAQMVAEFRALRASVVRLWSEAQNEFDREQFEEVTRFNEAIDQLLAESMTRYAKDVERSKDLLLGVLGHDLRNPLGAIMMSAHVLMEKEGPDWPQLKTASRIVRSGTRMDEIIKDLLDFTRTRLGAGMPVVRADMDMETICRQTVDEITAFHPDCIVHFQASGQLRGQWDSGRIGQALSNLVGNADQHGLENAPIEVALRGEPDQVVLTVHNKGPVIAKRDLQDIFNPFRQLDPEGAEAKNVQSIGLGLYIVEAIVTAHQGTIDVESTKRGTTFTVRLPRNQNASTPVPHVPSDAHGAEGA